MNAKQEHSPDKVTVSREMIATLEAELAAAKTKIEAAGKIEADYVTDSTHPTYESGWNSARSYFRTALGLAAKENPE